MKSFKFLRKNKVIMFAAPRRMNRMETFLYSRGWYSYCEGRTLEDNPYITYASKLVWRAGWLKSKEEHESI